MRKTSRFILKSFRFRRWSRKSYAVFAGLNKVISIGQVSVGICDRADLKTNSIAVAKSAIFGKIYLSENDEDEQEPDVLELLLNTNILQPTISIPAGCKLAQYLLIQSWNGSVCSIPTFLF